MLSLEGRCGRGDPLLLSPLNHTIGQGFVAESLPLGHLHYQPSTSPSAIASRLVMVNVSCPGAGLPRVRSDATPFLTTKVSSLSRYAVGSLPSSLGRPICCFGCIARDARWNP